MISDVQHRNRYFHFLRQLRAGGRTNMYGAVPYLMSAFHLDRESAFHIVCQWIDQQAGVQSKPEPRHRSSSSRKKVT